MTFYNLYIDLADIDEFVAAPWPAWHGRLEAEVVGEVETSFPEAFVRSAARKWYSLGDNGQLRLQLTNPEAYGLAMYRWGRLYELLRTEYLGSKAKAMAYAMEGGWLDNPGSYEEQLRILSTGTPSVVPQWLFQAESNTPGAKPIPGKLVYLPAIDGLPLSTGGLGALATSMPWDYGQPWCDTHEAALQMAKQFHNQCFRERGEEGPLDREARLLMEAEKARKSRRKGKK